MYTTLVKSSLLDKTESVVHIDKINQELINLTYYFTVCGHIKPVWGIALSLCDIDLSLRISSGKQQKLPRADLAQILTQTPGAPVRGNEELGQQP